MDQYNPTTYDAACTCLTLLDVLEEEADAFADIRNNSVAIQTRIDQLRDELTHILTLRNE